MLRPRKSFTMFRHGASRRGVFLLTYQEWWAVWQRSRHWHERGPCRGDWVMTRRDPEGPYAIGNLCICRKEVAVTALNRSPHVRAKRLGNQNARGHRHSAATRLMMSASHLKRHAHGGTDA
jgi:hypothetical protein